MFNDSRIVLPKLSKPVSFGALMALYESNYVRVMSFLASKGLIQSDKPLVWRNSENCIQVWIEEVTKYTVLLKIEEELMVRSKVMRMNQFRLRLYHDAKVATVQNSKNSADDYALDEVPIDGSRIAELWQQNMFFNKWLEYCSHRKLDLVNK